MYEEKNQSNNYSLELLRIFIKKWYIFVTITLVCLLVSVVWAVGFAKPLYNSTGKLYILNKNSQGVNTSNISVSTWIASDYKNLITDNVVLAEVSKNLDYKYSASYLESHLSVTNPQDTRFLEISIYTPSAEDSKLVIDSICEVSKEKIETLLEVDTVTIIRKGDIQTRPYNNSLRIVALGFIVGAVISSVVLIIISLFNDKLSTADDIERQLGLSVLGNIPRSYAKSKSKVKKSR